MNENRKKTGAKKSPIPGLVILAAILIFNAVGDSESAIAFIVVAVLIALVAAFISAARKGSAGKTPAAQTRPAQTRAPQFGQTPVRRAAGKEEAVHCVHSRGKEKYLEQLDGFLANGIIDKAEYRLMKERYSKLEIRDDYH